MDDVVIVDDDLLMLEVVTRNLRDTNLKIKCFSDELDALAYLQNHSTRVLIVDQRMPRLDGLDLLQRLADGGGVRAARAYLCSVATLPKSVRTRARQFGARALPKDVLRNKKQFLELLAMADLD